jgi:hypothetical protein
VIRCSGRFFEVFLFEDIPAADRRADEIYLAEVDRCSVYVGMFGNDYGFEDTAGVSPTEHEFDRASAAGKLRLIFVKGTDDAARHPKMLALHPPGRRPAYPPTLWRRRGTDGRPLRQSGGLS